MQVMNHRLRSNLEGAHQVMERVLEKIQTGEIFQIAQVLALVSVTAACEGEHAFQMAADSKQRRGIHGQFDRQRHKSARAPNDLRRAIHKRLHRIVAALQNVAVVEQECVGDVFEPRLRFVIVDRNRLFAQIGGGHHQGAHARIGKQQVLQRRIGQKHSQPRNPGCDRRGDSIAWSCPRQHDGPRRRLQQGRFLLGQLAQLARRLDVPHHDGERFAVAVLSLAQSHHGGFIGRIDRQMESADALDGHDFAGHQAIDTLP